VILANNSSNEQFEAVWHSAFVGLGSNMGDKLTNLKTAIKELKKHPQIKLTKVSGIYESLPIGLHEENPESFLNMVCRIQTSLQPQTLLQFCQHIEAKLGRQRKNSLVSSRTIDLDLLFYDDLICKNKVLVLPHPQALKRDFVLVPLGELVDTNWKDPMTGLNYRQICDNGAQINSALKRLSDWTSL
jgi:2-amino-4-hydroxy-6-hydroxymethyldihydropteridine diphosphokinase